MSRCAWKSGSRSPNPSESPCAGVPRLPALHPQAVDRCLGYPGWQRILLRLPAHTRHREWDRHPRFPLRLPLPPLLSAASFLRSDNNTKICLGGDSSKKVEMDLIEREVLKDVDLLKLSHHGSEGSNSIEFLCELKPEFIVCSAGYNSSNHPSSEVLLRMYEYDKIYGTKIYDNFKSTSNDGNIIYYSNDNSTINLIMIKNVGDYIFINWYSIVLIIEIILIIFLFISIFVKNKISVNRHLKNMKQ